MTVRTLTRADVASAPKRAFGVGSMLAQDLREWYEAGNREAVAGFTIGEKEDEGRDGSDRQLHDALCLLAGMKRERVAVIDKVTGVQVVSAKFNKPKWVDVPFTTGHRAEAMSTLGLTYRVIGTVGTKATVSLEFSETDEIEDHDDADDDE